MELNRRHRAILFVTLVLTGSALLIGAELKQSLGMMLLGIALAWALGSDAASNSYSRLKVIGRATYGWLRLPLVMMFSGLVFSLIYVASRGSPVPVITGMAIVGIAIAPFTELPSQKLWLKIPIFLLAGAAFFVPVVATAGLDSFAEQHAENFGATTVEGLIVLFVGIWWLSRGWRLIKQGLGAEMPPAEAPQEMGERKSTLYQYVSLFIGIIILSLWIGLLSWSASSDWVYPLPKSDSTSASNNLLMQTAFVVLLAWWPHSAWKRILSRESNFEHKYLRRHRRVTATAGMIFTLVVCLAFAYGTENGNDRILTEKITKFSAQMSSVASTIGGIKQRDLKTTSDYIQAYSEIETLLPKFDSQIQNLADFYQEASHQDERRGLINTQFFYKSHNPDVWKNNYEMLDLVRQVSALTKQETISAKNMAALPEQDQADFWGREFKPLLVKEDGLRQKIMALQRKMQGTNGAN